MVVSLYNGFVNFVMLFNCFIFYYEIDKKKPYEPRRPARNTNTTPTVTSGALDQMQQLQQPQLGNFFI